MQIKIKLCVLCIIILSSCNSYKKLTYLQKVNITGDSSYILKNRSDYKLQPTDILYVKIITQNKEINTLFNPEVETQSSSSYNELSSYLKNYPVNDSGFIELPILKKIKVSGLSIDSASNLIKEKAKQYLNDVQVIVRLISFRFTILGEVKTPGVKTVYDDQITVLEALAYAGDITYNGNRERILLIRSTENGNKTIRIDATNGNLIEKKDFYILPNDIIYVEPLRSTLFRERASDYLFVVSTLTSTITALLLIINIGK